LEQKRLVTDGARQLPMDEGSQSTARNERETKEIDKRQIQISIVSSIRAREESPVYFRPKVTDFSKTNGRKHGRSVGVTPAKFQTHRACPNLDSQ
jgi:hypothetical protein